MLQGNKNMPALTVLRLAWFKTGLNFMTLYPKVAKVVRLSVDVKMAKKLRQALICYTRPKPAYGRQGLDWIVGPE